MGKGDNAAAPPPLKGTVRITATSVVLVIILAVRVLGQVSIGLISGNVSVLAVYVLFSALYLLTMILVLMKIRWGSLIAMVLAAIDIISASYIGGFEGVGAACMDLLLLFFSLREYGKYKA